LKSCEYLCKMSVNSQILHRSPECEGMEKFVARNDNSPFSMDYLS
jgi:hypothetical protein